MKKIVVNHTPKEINLSKLNGNEIIAYCSKSDSGNYCVLAKLNSSGFKNKNLERDYQGIYGFITLSASNSDPRYCSNSWHGAIETASKNREVMVFETQEELLRAILDKRF